MSWTEKQRKERQLLSKNFTRVFDNNPRKDNPNMAKGFKYKKKGTYGPFFSEEDALKILRKR